MPLHDPDPLRSCGHKTAASARARAAACRDMAALDLSERTRRYFQAEAIAWDRIADELESKGTPQRPATDRAH
ncbi:MAG: hypothetical protein AB7E79_15475 [Rhodospirillaceae bacterium]